MSTSFFCFSPDHTILSITLYLEDVWLLLELLGYQTEIIVTYVFPDVHGHWILMEPYKYLVVASGKSSPMFIALDSLDPYKGYIFKQ